MRYTKKEIKDVVEASRKDSNQALVALAMMQFNKGLKERWIEK